MNEYTIMSCANLEGLVIMVKAHMQAGWQCQGGLMFDGSFYRQAMVR